MTAADKIEAARALIEPLTGHDEGPWASVHRGTRKDFQQGRDHHRVTTLKEATDPDAVAIVHVQWRERRAANARLIANAPDLRDTVAALADGWEAEKARADALAQEKAKLKSDTFHRLQGVAELEAALIEALAELIYLRKHGKYGARWESNESKDVWRDYARKSLDLSLTPSPETAP